MNSFLRCAVALTLGVGIAYRIQSKEKINSNECMNPLQRKYRSIISPDLLMSLIVSLITILVALSSINYFVPFNRLFLLFCQIFISVSIFFAIFLLILPVLRKYVSAKTIALIWLLPNYSYLALYRFMALDEPKLVVDIGNVSWNRIFVVWAIIASIVFLVYLIRHFVFRFQLLSKAKPVEINSVRELWETMQIEYEFKKPCIKIVVSDNTATPLSIGLFKRTTVLVLPHTNYAEEELRLIFKHELIHIIRSDSQTKLFIAFCNAICWFNPLMWIAMRKCTEDLELSCDEYVVEDCGKEGKDLYGSLILSAAGSNTGFTTCLSSSAEALKYRLTNIYKPKRRFKGGIIAGVLTAAMLLSIGNIAFSYNHQTMSDVFDKNEIELSSMSGSLIVQEEYATRLYYCDNLQGLHSYIMNLNVHELSGYYEKLYSESKELICSYKTDEGTFLVFLGDNEVKCGFMFEPGRQDIRTYYLDESVDWEYVMSMMSASH